MTFQYKAPHSDMCCTLSAVTKVSLCWTAFTALPAGCVPDLLLDNVISDGTPEPCSPNDPNSELTALLGIRNGLRQMMGSSKVLAAWSNEQQQQQQGSGAGARTGKGCAPGVVCNVLPKVFVSLLLFASAHRRAAIRCPETAVQRCFPWPAPLKSEQDKVWGLD